MGRRKEPERLSTEDVRQVMLRGITDQTAIFLFDQSMEALDAKGQAGFAAALQLRDACQWTVAINEMQDKLRRMIAGGEADEKRVGALIRSKQAAEDARRRILDGLLLTPQKARGRPQNAKTAKEENEEQSADAAQDAWAAFDDEDESAAAETSSAFRAPSPKGKAETDEQDDDGL